MVAEERDGAAYRENRPRELYALRIEALNARARALRDRERMISVSRLALVAMTLAIAFWNVAFAFVPLIAFIALVVVHDGVIRRRKRQESGAAFYERGVARIDGTWAGTGDAGNDFADEHHPYAADFDLFGRGSIFELISIAVTHAGRARLASWLKEPMPTGASSHAEIASRQRAVGELRGNVRLREDLAVAAAEVTREIQAARLAEWAAMPALRMSAAERIAVTALPSLGVVLLLVTLPSLIARLVGWTNPETASRLGVLAAIPVWPLAVAIIAILVLTRRLMPRVEKVIAEVERAEPALGLLAAVLSRIEKESFDSDRLSSLQGRFHGADDRASREIERLRRLVSLLDARRNQLFAPFAVLLLWTTHVAMAIERWRLRSGAHIGDWIEAVGEIEALASLASFAFEHPDFSMPVVVDGGPDFDACDLGHPLIPDERRVTNDIRLGGEVRLLVVSGSNMSGKSTMMRSVGIAAVLAMAGAPVCARSLRMTPMSVGASIRIHDSLQENASRFYAEILRIRQVLGMSTSGPLLFLLDEMLAGTNSHDRSIGAEAIVTTLIDHGAIGLVSTHDLALARIADSLAPRAANVHFEDHLEEGRVVFDYRMRPGVVTKSNAIALMRSVGIEV